MRSVNATHLKPIAFLDVDGNVHTAVDPANDFSDPRVPWALNEDLGVRYNPKIADWIQELHEVAELRWLTSWGHRARTELSPALGLPDFPAIVEQEEHRYPEFDWKHSAVLSQIVNEPGRPIVWLEDEPMYGGAYDQLVPYAQETGTPLFIVQPTISDGLTEAHMLRIRQFLTSVAQQPAARQR